MENRQVVVVKKDAGIAAAADLNGKFGVAESGSAGESYAKEFEGVNFKGFTKQTECLTEVKAATADFAVVDAQLAKSYCGKGVNNCSCSGYYCRIVPAVYRYRGIRFS